MGLQFVNGQWLRDALQEFKARGGEQIFGRMFFVPHPYGLNHPPSYQEDPNAVLGFLYFADIFREEIGFVPPMIAGEGGWKYRATDDNRFPRVEDQLHRDGASAPDSGEAVREPSSDGSSSDPAPDPAQ